MKKRIHFTILGVILAIAVLISLIAAKSADSPEEEVSFPLYPMKVEAKSDGGFSGENAETPLRIIIPSVAIDLAIKPASVSGNTWEFYKDAASYWTDSARSGETGNIILYAHNKKNLFGPLYEARIGKQILIDTNKGRKGYTIAEFKVVSPSQIEAFALGDEEKVTLLTCTNEDDADRLVIIAKPSASFAELLSDPQI